MGNEGLGWGFPILKMVHNPANDWHPVRGPHPSNCSVWFRGIKLPSVDEKSHQLIAVLVSIIGH